MEFDGRSQTPGPGQQANITLQEKAAALPRPASAPAIEAVIPKPGFPLTGAHS